MQAPTRDGKGGQFDSKAMAAGFALIAFSAALTYETIRLRAAWPPAGWPYSPEIPFVTPLIAGAHVEWRLTAAILTLWSVAYLFALLQTKSIQLTKRIAIVVVALQCVLLGIALTNRIPFNSDQYAYVAYGDLVDAGLNPYVPPLKTHPGLAPSIAAVSTVWAIDQGASDALQRVILRDRYGPVFTLAAGAVLYPIRSLSVEAQALMLRLIAALACVGCSSLLALWSLKRRASALALAAFALSPAIVLQTAQGAHNDVYALLFALAAAFALRRDRPLLAALALALSIGIKVSFAPFALPFLAYTVARRGISHGVAAGGIIAVVLAIAAAPFGLQHALLQPIADLQTFNAPHILGALHDGMRHLPHVFQLSEAALNAAYDAALVICTLFVTYRASHKEIAWTACAGVLLLTYFAGNLEPWYVMILVPLLLMPLAWATPVFIGTSLASQIFQGNDFIEQHGHIPIVPFIVLMLLLCGLAYALFTPERTTIRQTLEGSRATP